MPATDVPISSFSTCRELLKFLRRGARLSQKELSIAVGYSESHISRIEHNERSVDRTSLLALFVPALHIQNELGVVERLLALCEQSQPSLDAALPASVAPSPAPISQPASHNHLPAQLTSFMGRQDEVAELCELLGDPEVRLVTLTGVGGCGKTRLALRAGEAVAHQYAHGVWLAELAALTDPHLLPKTVAATFHLSERIDQPVLLSLTDFLHPRQALLILDNCEHLVEAVARLVAALLRACPRLQILATSRESPGVPGEVNVRVQPLALPPALPAAKPTCAEVEGYDAIRLFVERAHTTLRTFALTDQNAPAVVRICQRLDGIPLGIELAAGWVHLLSPEQIAARLEQNFDLLVSDSWTVLPRQQTLRGAMEWSYNLLPEAERRLLRRLSVFAGGWSLAAAEAVTTGVSGGDAAFSQQQVLALLSRLVNKSLVIVGRPAESEARYRLLEPIREYLREKLAEAGEEGEACDRHLRYFYDLARQLEIALTGPPQPATVAALDLDYENFRAALAWGFSMERSSAVDDRQAVSLAACLGRFWSVRQHWREGRHWLTKALASLDSASLPDFPEDCERDHALRAKLLFLAGNLANDDLSVAQRLLEESLAIQRTLGDGQAIARCLHELGSVANEQGDYEGAATFLAESLSHSRELGDDWMIAVSLLKLADLAGEQADHLRCEEYAAECLPIAQRLGDISMQISCLNLLAQCAIATGRCEQAIALLEEGLALDRRHNPQSKGGPGAFATWAWPGSWQRTTARRPTTTARACSCAGSGNSRRAWPGRWKGWAKWRRSPANRNRPHACGAPLTDCAVASALPCLPVTACAMSQLSPRCVLSLVPIRSKQRGWRVSRCQRNR